MEYDKHPSAIVESAAIGEGTSIAAHAHVRPGARIGRRCVIGDHVFIDNGVVVGDGVTVKCGAQLWAGVTIEDHAYIGPHAVLTKDPPPARADAPTVVQAGASIGANATILPGVIIGQGATVRAGTVVEGNVPANSIVVGNPAHIVGYVDAATSLSGTLQEAPAAPGSAPTTVRGVTLHRLPLVEDLRGWLSFGEANRHVPFGIQRYFLVFEVASERIRGEHAHKRTHQFLVCVHGKCNVLVDDGQNRQVVVLDHPTLGIHVSPMIWTVQFQHSRDAVLLVFASERYDPDDYIRDYAAFLAAASKA
jgi:acetyltransferase-like isoleucine patch superfamily enzyme/dTDP-4-dehydrorhamnose 3,5-epimerase-like enzyme